MSSGSGHDVIDAAVMLAEADPPAGRIRGAQCIRRGSFEKENAEIAFGHTDGGGRFGQGERFVSHRVP